MTRVITAMAFVSVFGSLQSAEAQEEFGADEANAHNCNGYSSGVSPANEFRGWTATWFDDFNSFDSSKWSNVESPGNNYSAGIHRRPPVLSSSGL